MGRLGQAKHMRPSFKMFVKHPDTYRNHHARYTFMHLYTPDSCGTFALFAIHATYTTSAAFTPCTIYVHQPGGSCTTSCYQSSSINQWNGRMSISQLYSPCETYLRQLFGMINLQQIFYLFIFQQEGQKLFARIQYFGEPLSNSPAHPSVSISLLWSGET